LLKAKRVQDITLVRYSAALREFDQYMKRRKLKCTSIQRVDRYMAEYFADLCDQGASYNSATYVLFGYLMLRADECIPDKQLMSHSRAALKGWSSKYPQCSRTGADPLIWFLLGSHMHASFAAALLLQLDTYARPSEILKLRKQDIIRPSSKHCKFWGVIFGNSNRGDVTKTGTQDDTVLLDSTDRAFAVTVLAAIYKSLRRDEDLLFPNCTLEKYETAMRAARQRAGLSAFQFTPHSVRHSGPSLDFLHKTRLPEEILSRGRWKTMKSILRYQKPGQMLSRMNKIPQEVWDEAKLALPKVLRKIKQFYSGG
jgi:integrase